MIKSLGDIHNDKPDNVEINLSPLIDMVFLLLIFFMVTTVFIKETGVQIQKPKAVTGKSLQKNSILIAITANNKIVYAGQEIGLNGVRAIVSQLLRNKKELPVIITADTSVSTGLTVQVIDECKLAGAKQVSIATENR